MIERETIRWRFSNSTWMLGGIALPFLYWLFSGGFENLVTRWNAEEEYSHGYLIPLVSLLFIWELRPRLQQDRFDPSWMALAVVLLALLIDAAGEISALFLLIHFAFILLLIGFSLALLGWRGTRLLLVPVSLLVFAIPIPYFLEATLTAKLQLVSTQLGVELIRVLKIPVFREGNLIDLGAFKLEVIEACSGLTYLYPLMWFGCIFAYIYRTEWWKRVVLILSTIPLAILLNSIRIGLTGVLVRFFGPGMAKGFLHDFQGWAVFMVCIGILLAEIWMLTRVGADRRPFGVVFGLDLAGSNRRDAGGGRVRPLSRPFVAAVGLVVLSAVLLGSVQERAEDIPQRETFPSFPMALGSWRGQSATLDDDSLKALKLTDYILADFSRGHEPAINFYVAYYDSQRKGVSPHSPTVCIPGGGWQVTDSAEHTLSIEAIANRLLHFNRIVIRKGDSTSLVYYWFQERGRLLSNEYWTKWYLFRDAVAINRTDGALVRVTTSLLPGEAEEEADKRLAEFVNGVMPLMDRYVPGL